MTANTQLQPTAGDQPSPSGPKGTAAGWRSGLAAGLSPRNIGAVYVLVAICIVFSIWAPSTFPQGATIKQVLDNNAITALAALALIVPLSARVFDLSFAYVMSLSGVTAAHFVAADNWPVLLALLAGIAVALVIGLVNGFVVVIMRIDSFIGTLATGSLVQAFISFVTNDNSINSERLSGAFSTMSQGSIGGIIYPVFYAVIIAAALWVFMDHTATGRRLYATGFNPNAARLADIRVNKLRFCSLLVSAGLAGFAGVLLASSLAAGSPSAGTSYLLPGFASVFVGATVFKHGRFNAWGTIVAVLVLAIGIAGLQQLGNSFFVEPIFQGAALIISVGLAGYAARRRKR